MNMLIYCFSVAVCHHIQVSLVQPLIGCEIISCLGQGWDIIGTTGLDFLSYFRDIVFYNALGLVMGN